MLKNVRVFEGIYPEEVFLPNEIKLRLCHIDVDTYQSAKDIFIHVWPKINKGGCVVFDDYGFWGCEGVTALCNELNLSDGVFIYNLNGHALFIKL
jgi:O-methyltransferase